MATTKFSIWRHVICEICKKKLAQIAYFKTKDVILVRHLLQFAPKVLVGALGRQYARGTLRSVSMFAGGDSSCLPVSSYMYIEPEVPEYLDIFCPLTETRNEGLKCTLYKIGVYHNFDFNKFSICAVVSNCESAS